MKTFVSREEEANLIDYTDNAVNSAKLRLGGLRCLRLRQRECINDGTVRFLRRYDQSQLTRSYSTIFEGGVLIAQDRLTQNDDLKM